MFTVEMSNPDLNLTCVMVAGRRLCAMFVNAYVYLLFFTCWSPGSFGKRGWSGTAQSEIRVGVV